MDRTIIVNTDRACAAAISAINGNWRALNDAGQTIAVRIYPHKEKATDEQRGLMWVRLQEISEQIGRAHV